MVRTAISRRGMVAGGALLSAALAAPHVARAAPRRLRLGHNNTDGSHFAQGAMLFAASVAADPALSAAIAVEVHGNAELGDELNLLKDVSAGTLDLALSSTGAASGLVPQVGVLDALFLFHDADRARAALDGPVGAELAAVMQARGLNLLAWAENGVRHVTANKPVRGLADLKGLRIRVPQSDVEVAGFQALGAEPKQLAFTQLREALRTGQFDAQENPVAVIVTNKLYEVQKVVSLTGHIYSAGVFVASSDVLEDLSPPQRAALAACAAKGGARTREVAATYEREGVERLKAAGMQVVTDVDTKAMVQAARPVLDALGAKYGAPLVQRIVAAGA